MSVFDPKQDAAALAGIIGPFEARLLQTVSELPVEIANALKGILDSYKVVISFEKKVP